MSSDDPSTTQLLQLAMQRIERLEAEVATLKNVIYSGKTDIDVDLPVSVVETVEVPAATIEVVEVPAAIIEPAQEPAHEPAPSHRLAALPIRAWFHGSAPIHTRCYIAWDDNRPGLAVFSSDARATDGKTLPELELDLVRDVVSVHYTDPDDVRNRYPVVALVRRDGPNDGQQSQTQTQTQMTLALDSRDAEWSGARYRELIAWLQAQLCEKDCVGVFCCRYGVAEMIWETAARAACGEVPAGEPGVLPARLKPSAATQLQVVHPPTPRELFASTFVPGHHLQLGEKTKYLTVGAWYHGGRLSQADEAYLVWPVSGRMCIVSGARGARCIEELNVGTAAKAAWFVDPQESYQDKVFVLELKTTTAQSSSSSQNDGAVSAPYRTAETVAVQHEEEIIIKFNGAAAWWMDSAYEAFVSWIKGKVDQHAMLRGKGGDAKWEEAAKRMVSPLTDSETRLQVRLSEVGVSSRAPRRTRKNALPRALPTDSGDQGSKTRIKMEMHVKEEAKADNPSGGSLSNGVPAAEKINTNSGNHMSSGSPSRKRPRVDSSGDTSATKLRNLVAKRGSGSKHRPSEVTKRQVTNEEEDEWVKRDGEVATIRDWDETPSEIGLPSRAPIVSQEERTALPLPSQIRDASQISSAWKKPPTKIGPPTNASRNKPRVDSSGETPSEMVPSFAPITSSEDRNSISGLHLSRPQQMRDASASSWKKPPTKISPPIHASRILSSTPSSGRLSNNLHSTRGGNPAAQRTVTSFVNNPRGDPPPAKRQRVDTSTPTSRKKVSQSSNSASHTPRLGDPDDTGVIIIDDDFGERIELDDLNLSGSSRSWNSQLIPDGPSTALLRRETQRQELILRRETSKDRKEVSQSSNSAPGEIF